MKIWYRSSASRWPPAEKKESNSTQYTYLTVYTSLNIYPIILSLSFAICFKLQHPYLSFFFLVFISPTTLLIYNPGQSSPSLVIPLPCWFITASLAFFYLTELIFCTHFQSMSIFFHLKPSFFLVVLQMPLLRFSILLGFP